MGKLARVKIHTDRTQISFKPKWEGEIEGYAVRFIEKNLWKVVPECDFADLYQDAFLYFLTCAERYPTVSEAPHFMSLFKSCLFNRITELAKRRTRFFGPKRMAPIKNPEAPGGEVDAIDVIPSDSTDREAAELAMLVEDAPEDVRRLIAASEDPTQPRRFLRYNKTRETTDDYLCRIAGLNKPSLRKDFENWIEGITVHGFRISQNSGALSVR